MAQALTKFITNPVAQKELRSRMRGRRAFVVISLYLLVMSGMILLIYGSVTTQGFSPNTLTREAGQAIFFTVVVVQIFLAAFIGPAFTSGTISGEKERQTYDLLRTTLLPARKLVGGKLLSALTYVFILIAASLPLHGIALMLGGVNALEFGVSQLLIMVASTTYALWGMYVSTVMRSTLASTVVTYAGTLFMLLALPFLFILTESWFGNILYGYGSFRPSNWELALYFAAFLFACTNLIFTIFVSEGWYIENDVVFFYDRAMGGGLTLTLPSLWWVFIIIYLLVALLLYWRCIKRIQRIAQK